MKVFQNVHVWDYKHFSFVRVKNFNGVYAQYLHIMVHAVQRCTLVSPFSGNIHRKRLGGIKSIISFIPLFKFFNPSIIMYFLWIFMIPTKHGGRISVWKYT